MAVLRIPATIKATAVVMLLMFAGPPAGAADGAASNTVELTMSNFHYCAAATCSPADVGYVRTESGPVVGTDNPARIVDVAEGSTVRWVYRDASCDSDEECAGHNVRFEDGTKEGTRVGGVKARSGPGFITATMTQKAGTLIRYFCSVQNHWRRGMTGVIRVVAAK
jgi:plastocyanin